MSRSVLDRRAGPALPATGVAVVVGDLPPVSGPGQGAAAAGVPHSRYVVVRDRDGRRAAVTRHAVSAVCETEEGGSLLLLPGGRIVHVGEDLDTVLGWLA